MAEIEATDVGRTFLVLYRSLHEGLRGQVRDLDQGTLNWSPLPRANSIAVLVTHTIGSERDMLCAIRLLPSDRDREAEFKVEADAAQLIELIDAADREVEEHLSRVTPEDLLQERPRANRDPHIGLYWLISNYGHAREHLAQIELTKQLYDSRT